MEGLPTTREVSDNNALRFNRADFSSSKARYPAGHAPVHHCSGLSLDYLSKRSDSQ
jgi:hypothetical protein